MRPYRGKISGPLLDRIDLHDEMASLDRLPMPGTNLAEVLAYRGTDCGNG